MRSDNPQNGNIAPNKTVSMTPPARPRRDSSRMASKSFVGNSWCTSTFDKTMGNAEWGSMPPEPSSSGDHNANWRSQSAHPSGTGWGLQAAWPSHGATSAGTAAGMSFPTHPSTGSMYAADSGGWTPPNYPPAAPGGWDSSMTQPCHGQPEWSSPRPFYGTASQPSFGANSHPPYQSQADPSRYFPPPAPGGWPSETLQPRHRPAATPISSQHRGHPREPSVGSGPPGLLLPPPVPRRAPQPGPPSTPLPEPGGAGDAPQKPPARITTDTKVVCGALSRLATLPPDPRRWLVLLARLEEAPTAAGTRRAFKVREPDGTRTECVFYELERPLPTLQVGGWVRCVGRLDGRGVFVCVTVRQAGRQDIGLHRQLQQLATQPAAGDRAAAAADGESLRQMRPSGDPRDIKSKRSA